MPRQPHRSSAPKWHGNPPAQDSNLVLTFGFYFVDYPELPPSMLLFVLRARRTPENNTRQTFGPRMRAAPAEMTPRSSPMAQLPKADLLTFWFSSFGPFLVLAPKD